MVDNNKNHFRPFRSSDKQQTSQPQQKVSDSNKDNPTSHIPKKDIFLMSFFGVLAAGIIILLLLLVTGVLTGYVSFDIDLPEFPGEEEVILEETPVIPIEENVTETVVEEVVEEEEEEVLPCDEDISLELDDGYRYGLKVITLKLVGEYSAQISIGGKSGFIDVGSTETINGLDITLIDASESVQSAIIQVAC